MDYFPADVPSTATLLIGYFKPPNNVKRWIVEERDLKMMYSLCDPGSKVILWYETKVKNENDENNMPFVSKKKTSCEVVDHEEEIDTIFQQLQEQNWMHQNHVCGLNLSKPMIMSYV